MKEIKLTQGYVALVDDEDYDYLNQFKWNAKEGPRSVYAKRKVKNRDVTMHRFILGVTDPKVKVDHKDGDGLNNRRFNLRTANNHQNQHNRKPNKNSTSGFKGVTWRKDLEKWNAALEMSGKRLHLGYFDCPLEAACAYDMAAVKHFGEFAHCNFAIPN